MLISYTRTVWYVAPLQQHSFCPNTCIHCCYRANTAATMANIGSYMLSALVLVMIILPILVWQICGFNIFLCDKYQFMALHEYTGGTWAILLLLAQILVHTYRHYCLKLLSYCCCQYVNMLIHCYYMHRVPLLLHATARTVLVVYAQC